MYVVLAKGKKVLILKEETYLSRPDNSKCKTYTPIKYSSSWKECQQLLREVKNGTTVYPAKSTITRKRKRKSKSGISEDLLNKIHNMDKKPVDIIWSSEKGDGLHYVYGLYDINDKLTYIGVTNRPRKRLKEHRKSGKTPHHMEIILSYDDRLEAESMERFAIRELEPPLNILIEGLNPEYYHSLADLDKFGKLVLYED